MPEEEDDELSWGPEFITQGDDDGFAEEREPQGSLEPLQRCTAEQIVHVPCVPMEPSQHPRRFSLGTLELLETFLAPFPGRTLCDVKPAVDSANGRSLEAGSVGVETKSTENGGVEGGARGRGVAPVFPLGDARWARQWESDRYENSDAQLVRALLFVQPEPEVQPLTQPPTQTGCGLLRCVGLHRF